MCCVKERDITRSGDCWHHALYMGPTVRLVAAAGRSINRTIAPLGARTRYITQQGGRLLRRQMNLAQRVLALGSLSVTERNARNLCIEVFWATFLSAVTAFNAPFALRLGATNTEIGRNWKGNTLLTEQPDRSGTLDQHPGVDYEIEENTPVVAAAPGIVVFAAPAGRGALHISMGVSMEEGALARLGGISLVGVRQACVTLGETVVVLGLGLIGQFAARLSRLAGARPVIGVDLISNRVQIAAASGIYAINPSEAEVTQVVKEMTGGRMAGVVIEATGNPEVMPLALDLAARGGRVVLLGSLRGKINIDAYSTIHKGISLIGAHESISVHPYTFLNPWTRERNLDVVLGLLFDRSLKSDGLISHRIQPDDIPETYEMLVY